MGLISKSLALLPTLTNKFWQFGDSDTAPVHIILDPSTGAPLDYSGPTLVTTADAQFNFNSVTAAGNIFDAIDAKGYNSFSLKVKTIASSTTLLMLNSDTLEDTNYDIQPVWYQRPSLGVNRENITAAGRYHGPIIGRYLRLGSSAYGTGETAVELTLHSAPFVAEGMRLVGLVDHSQAANIAPVLVGGVVSTAQDSTLVSGDMARILMTKSQQAVVIQDAIREAKLQYTAPASGLANTNTAVQVAAAPGSGFRNVIKGASLMAEALTNATEFVVREATGGAVLFRTKIGTAGLPHTNIPQEIVGGDNKALEIDKLTASGTGAVYFNANVFKEVV